VELEHASTSLPNAPLSLSCPWSQTPTSLSLHMLGGGTNREEEGENLTRPEAESFVKLLKLLLFEPPDSIMAEGP